MDEEMDHINIVPLLDIMLVLLTIVLTTATFVANGRIPVDLAKSSAAAPAQAATLVLTMAGATKAIWLTDPLVGDRFAAVTALAPGKAVISAYTTQGETLTCTVTVTSEIGKVTLDADVLLLHSIGSQQDLIPTVAVQEPSAVALQWTSSDPSVAVVDADGTVTAVADGKAIVTVRTPEGRSAGCAVYVGQAAADYEKRDRQLTKAALGGMGILGALFLLLGIAL